MVHRGVLAASLGCLLLGVTLSADTLFLRDGRRVSGRVIAMRDGMIEFEQRGFVGRERVRIDRVDVRRIEFDDEDDLGDRFDRDNRGSDRDRMSGSSRPSGLRERDISVDAARPWSDTGIEVRSGQMIYFSATGRVRWGPGRQDGPRGEDNSPRNPGRPIPNRPAAALIGRVGEGTDYFFIGDEEGPIRMRSSGRLHLGINDDFLQDNSGSFRVTVYY